jgi:chromosome segregation ATPase
MTVTCTRADNLMLTPRVIDESAFDEFAGMLRQLIDQAEHAERELRECAREVSESGREQKKSAEQLQERLRLGARMLKAFQSQIMRTESALTELSSREEKVRAVELQAEAAVTAATERIDAAVDEAMRRVSEQLEDQLTAALERMDRETNARAERLQQLAAEVDTLMPSVDRMAEVAQNAEIKVTSIAHRAASLLVELNDRCAAVETLIDRSNDTAQQLEAGMLRTVKHAEELTGRTGQATERIEQACQRGVSLSDELARQIDVAHAASRGLAIDMQACEAMEALHEQLKPWEALVLGGDDRKTNRGVGDINLPEPAARLIDEMRARLDRDLDAFSSVLAHVAEQFRAFASREHVRREVRELDAREDRGGSNAIPATDGGDEGVVPVIRSASPLSFSSHAKKISRAE